MNACLVTHSLSFVELEPNVDHSPPKVPLFRTLLRQAINQMKNPSPGKSLLQINDFSDLLAVQTLHRLEQLYVNPNELQIRRPWVPIYLRNTILSRLSSRKLPKQSHYQFPFHLYTETTQVKLRHPCVSRLHAFLHFFYMLIV